MLGRGRKDSESEAKQTDAEMCNLLDSIILDAQILLKTVSTVANTNFRNVKHIMQESITNEFFPQNSKGRKRKFKFEALFTVEFITHFTVYLRTKILHI